MSIHWIEFDISPSEPIKDFIAIIRREVDTACFISSHSSAISAGTIRNHHPAPTSPVMVPTTTHSHMVIIDFFHSDNGGEIFLFPFLLHTIEHPAANMINQKMRRRSVHFSIRKR